MFESEAEASTANRRIAIPRGKVLGGSSAINGMLYVRGQVDDYNGWAQRGNPGWSYDDVLPYFKKAEHCQAMAAGDTDFDSAIHGVGGPLNVAPVKNRYEALDRVIAAAKILGWPHNKIITAARRTGFLLSGEPKNGLRFSAKKAYLDPARHRRNLHIVTSAHVTKILFDGHKATGVRYQRHDRQLSAFAGRR